MQGHVSFKVKEERCRVCLNVVFASIHVGQPGQHVLTSEL